MTGIAVEAIKASVAEVVDDLIEQDDRTPVSKSAHDADAKGVAMLCVSYLDAGSPAHMRYTIRRLRRRLPKARVLLGCWMADADALRETVKPDDVAVTLRDAVRLCLVAARKPAGPALIGTPAGVTVDAA